MVNFNMPGGTNRPQPIAPDQFFKWIGFAFVGMMLLSSANSLFYQVGPDEVGVVQQFGRYARTAQSGLHMKLPFGIEQVRLVKVTFVDKEEFGFRTVNAGVRTVFARPNEYMPTHRASSSDPFLQESLMLTGDLNVVVVEWVVQYRVKDAVDFSFNLRSPKETIRNMSEAVMRLVIADYTIDEVLTSDNAAVAGESKSLVSRRDQIQEHVKNKLQEILDSYKSGIEIKNVILKEAMPPNEVKPSFNEVNEAYQEKEKLINQAWAEYNRIIPKAKGEAEQTIRNAEGYALERINNAKGDAERFTLGLEAYRKAPEVTKRRLYLEMAEKVFPQLKDKWLMDSSQQGILPLLNLEESRRAES